jgi:hypothetical protein
MWALPDLWLDRLGYLLLSLGLFLALAAAFAPEARRAA